MREPYAELIDRCTWIIIEHIIKGSLRDGVGLVFNHILAWQKAK